MVVAVVLVYTVWTLTRSLSQASICTASLQWLHLHRSFAECIHAATEAVLDLAGCDAPNAPTGMVLVTAVRDQLQLWHTLLARLAQNPSDQVLLPLRTYTVIPT
jgi:hypothetical protein